MGIQEWSDRIWIVELGEEPGFTEDLQMIRGRIEKRTDAPAVIIDLSAVRMINSSQLSELLRMRKLMTDRESRLRLTGPGNTVWAVFLATGLDKVFKFSEDVSLALAQLQIE